MPDLFLSIIGLYFLIISIKDKLFYYFKDKFILILALFYIFLLISGLLSDDPFNSLINFNGPIFYFRYIFFILAVKYLLVKNIKILKPFTYILVSTVVFTVIDGFIQYLTGSNIFGFPPTGNRITGMFKDEEILGHFLAHITPVALALIIYFLKLKNIKQIIFIMFFLVICEVMIFISNDRAGFLKIFQFTLLLIFLSNNFKLFRLISFSISILIIFLLINFSDHSNKRLDDTIREVSSTTIPYMPWSALHEKHYKIAFKIYKENPIFGGGPQKFKYYCTQNPKIEGCTSQPHNYYIQTLSELGIPGIVFLSLGFFYFLLRLLSQFVRVWFIKKSDKKFPDHIVVLNSQIFLIFWPLIPTQSFYNNWLNVFIFLTIALNYYFSNEKEHA